MTVSVSLRCRWTSPLRAWKQSLRPAIPFPSKMQQSDWAGLDQRQHKPFRLWLNRYLRSWHSRMKLWLAFKQTTRCPISEANDGPWTRARGSACGATTTAGLLLRCRLQAEAKLISTAGRGAKPPVAKRNPGVS